MGLNLFILDTLFLQLLYRARARLQNALKIKNFACCKVVYYIELYNK